MNLLPVLSFEAGSRKFACRTRMAIPKEILSVEHARNTFVVAYGESETSQAKQLFTVVEFAPARQESASRRK